MLSPGNNSKHVDIKKKARPLRYKELRASYKLKQRWSEFLNDDRSAEYAVLSGNFEQAINQAFFDDPNYIDATVTDFRNSPEGRCIVNVAIRFKLEELNPAGKAQKLIVEGSISGMPVDSDYFVVFSLSETSSKPPPKKPEKQTLEEQMQNEIEQLNKPITAANKVQKPITESHKVQQPITAAYKQPMTEGDKLQKLITEFQEQNTKLVQPTPPANVSSHIPPQQNNMSTVATTSKTLNINTTASVETVVPQDAGKIPKNVSITSAAPFTAAAPTSTPGQKQPAAVLMDSLKELKKLAPSKFLPLPSTIQIQGNDSKPTPSTPSESQQRNNQSHAASTAQQTQNASKEAYEAVALPSTTLAPSVAIALQTDNATNATSLQDSAKPTENTPPISKEDFLKIAEADLLALKPNKTMVDETKQNSVSPLVSPAVSVPVTDSAPEAPSIVVTKPDTTPVTNVLPAINNGTVIPLNTSVPMITSKIVVEKK
jgi:hypothetical protein